MQKFAKVNFLRVEQKFQSTWVGVHMMTTTMMMNNECRPLPPSKILNYECLVHCKAEQSIFK